MFELFQRICWEGFQESSFINWWGGRDSSRDQEQDQEVKGLQRVSIERWRDSQEMHRSQIPRKRVCF